MRRLHRALAALATSALTGWASAGEIPIQGLTPDSAKLQQANQRLADELAGRLNQSGQLKGYYVDIEADGGVVTLTGTVADSAQKAAIEHAVRQHPGVISTLSRLEVASPATLVVANYEPAGAPQAMPPRMPQGYGQPGFGPQGYGQSGMGPRGMAAGPLAPIAADGKPANGKVLEPAHIRQFPGGVAPYSDSPIMPPYSWPAYTPYNNFASLAYQTQYPSGAWPFIGPPYPYPMIPSGWRSVSLKWSHGYWWLKFCSH